MIHQSNFYVDATAFSQAQLNQIHLPNLAQTFIPFQIFYVLKLTRRSSLFFLLFVLGEVLKQKGSVVKSMLICNLAKVGSEEAVVKGYFFHIGIS